MIPMGINTTQAKFISQLKKIEKKIMKKWPVLSISAVSDANFSVKGAASPLLAHLEKFRLDFSSPSFVIRVNLSPSPSLSLYSLLFSLWCFPILVNYYFQIFFNLKVLLYVANITQNTATKLL